MHYLIKMNSTGRHQYLVAFLYYRQRNLILLTVLHKSHTVISIVTYFLDQAKHRLDKPCPFLNINESVAPLVALVDHLLKSCTDHPTGWVCQMIVYQSHELSLSISAFIESSQILDMPNKTYCNALSW